MGREGGVSAELNLFGVAGFGGSSKREITDSFAFNAGPSGTSFAVGVLLTVTHYVNQSGKGQFFDRVDIRGVEGGIDSRQSSLSPAEFFLPGQEISESNLLPDNYSNIYYRRLCRKLIYTKALAADVAKDAPRLVAGALRWLWSVKNLSYLAPEMAEGQSGALTAFITDVNQRWITATDQPWYALLSGLELELSEGLARLGALPYDEFYDHLEPIFERVGPEQGPRRYRQMEDGWRPAELNNSVNSAKPRNI